MGICPLVAGGQIISNGISMTIQYVNFETCCCECIYYDTCSKKFISLEVIHSCLICKTEQKSAKKTLFASDIYL